MTERGKGTRPINLEISPELAYSMGRVARWEQESEASLRTIPKEVEGEITQEDRDLAAWIYESFAVSSITAAIRNGKHDDNRLVKKITRHRRQAIVETERRVAWQPIDTAPLDTVILAAEQVIGEKWTVWQIRVLPDGIVNAWTMEPMDFRPEGPPLPFAPTHWMPVPLASSIRSTEDERVQDQGLRGDPTGNLLSSLRDQAPTGLDASRINQALGDRK